MIRRLGLAAVALAASTPAFHYERPVELAPALAPETCVALPLDLLSHAAPRLEDLRVMAGDREIAYQLRMSSDVAEDVGRPEQILNLGERNGAISFDVEMTTPRYSRVLLKMARSHFSVLVHVSGIDRRPRRTSRR
jgi:acyl-CoA synthetase (NDP forming)